jgi:hypothetical protein
MSTPETVPRAASVNSTFVASCVAHDKVTGSPARTVEDDAWKSRIRGGGGADSAGLGVLWQPTRATAPRVARRVRARMKD